MSCKQIISIGLSCIALADAAIAQEVQTGRGAARTHAPGTVKAQEAPPDKEFAGYAEAQFLFGVHCKERLKDDARAYKYLELAAKQNHRDAWLYLGKCYFLNKDKERSHLLWAKLCYMAAERLKADIVSEYAIGLIEGYSGNLQEFKRWMQLAADNGHRHAGEMLANVELHKEIIGIRRELEKQGKVSSSRQPGELQAPGAMGAYVVEMFSKKPVVGTSSKMIRMPHPPEIVMPGWTYDPKAKEAEISQQIIVDRRGDERLISDDFLEQPLMGNLYGFNATIRALSAGGEEGIEESLSKSSYRLCGQDELKRLMGLLVEPADGNVQTYENDRIWDLGNGLYFHINVDYSGAYDLREYQFFMVKDGKASHVVTYPAPPDVVDAAIYAGVVQGNEACMNNLAVDYAEGNMDIVGSRDFEAEKYLLELSKRSHVVGTYNLAVYHRREGNLEEAKRYFDLAERLHGNSVISYDAFPAEIFDRHGTLLVKNKLYRLNNENPRIYARGEHFAAQLLGRVQVLGKEFGTCDFEGYSGIERLIFRKKLRHPVYLTLDSSLQVSLAKTIDGIAAQCKPRHAYGVIVSSKGELVAAAQSAPRGSQLADDSKKSSSLQWNDCLFMPAGYVLPISDEWMQLLGSSTDAEPSSKAAFQLHVKQGIFRGEARGSVLGLDGVTDRRYFPQGTAQTATMLNYVCAYIGVAEKKDIPQLSVYTDKVNTPLSAQGGVEWISFERATDGSGLNALGVIKTSDVDEKLYICIRIASDTLADTAETVVRNFSLDAASK